MPTIRKRRVYFVVALVVLSPVIAIAALRALMTTPKNLGVVDGRLAACPNSPNCVSTQATDKQHKIEPIAFDGSPDDAMRRLQSAIAAIPRMKIITRTEDYFHAEATTLILRFKDDVEIFVDRQAKVIHFRSASRVGHSDLGANRARMERIRKIFEQP